MGRMKHSPGFLKLVDDARRRIREIDIHEVKRWLDSDKKFCLIDVREESEWAAGRLPLSIHIGRGILERDIERTIPDKKPHLCSIAVADTAPCWRPRACRRWAIPTCGQCPAVGAAGSSPGIRWPTIRISSVTASLSRQQPAAKFAGIESA